MHMQARRPRRRNLQSRCLLCKLYNWKIVVKSKILFVSSIKSVNNRSITSSIFLYRLPSIIYSLHYFHFLQRVPRRLGYMIQISVKNGLNKSWILNETLFYLHESFRQYTKEHSQLISFKMALSIFWKNSSLNAFFPNSISGLCIPIRNTVFRSFLTLKEREYWQQAVIKLHDYGIRLLGNACRWDHGNFMTFQI